MSTWSARDPLASPEKLIRRVYAYVAHRVGDGADAEDVTSQTFERAVRYRDSYDRRRGEPVVWLLGIARRCIDDSWRERSAGPARVALDLSEIRADGAFEELSVRRLDLRAALAVLDDREQELVALRYGADLTSRQIGQILDLRTNTVEVALHRALAHLRAELERPQTEELRATRAS